MTGDTTPRPPIQGGERHDRRRLALVIGLVTAALLSAVLALTISSRHQVTSSAQIATPSATSTPWARPTLEALHLPHMVWLDPAGQSLPSLPSGTITTPCTHDNFTLHIAPEAPGYPRTMAVVFDISVVFTGPHPCDIFGVTLPDVKIFDSSHNIVWDWHGQRGAGATAYIPEGQLTAPGDALTGQVAWVQDVCTLECPGTQAPSGTYTAELWFWPYGQSHPATVQIGA